MAINDPFYARGFKAYRFYIAVKLHATTSYDIFKYNAAVSAKEETYLGRRDKYWFAKIGHKYKNDADLMEFFVANWIESGELNWVGTLSDAESESKFKAWKKRQESLIYQFTKDMDYLFETYGKPSAMTKVTNGNVPPLIQEYAGGQITIETVVILDKLSGCLDYIKKQLVNDEYVFPKMHLTIRKYAPFVRFDKSKAASILKEMVEDFA